jgi:hypothetical protein
MAAVSQRPRKSNVPQENASSLSQDLALAHLIGEIKNLGSPFAPEEPPQDPEDIADLADPALPEDPTLEAIQAAITIDQEECIREARESLLNTLRERERAHFENFLNQLKRSLNEALRKNLSKAFPGFIESLLEKIDNGEVPKLSREDFFAAYLKHKEAFHQVRRTDGSNMDQMALFDFVDRAILEEDRGLFHKVKYRVSNGPMPILLSAYHVFGSMLPIASDEEFFQYIESYIDIILDAMLPTIEGAVFILLLDVTSSSCGCCGSTKIKLTRQEREQLISGAKDLLKGICKKFLNEDIVEGVAGIADVLISGITRGNSNVRSDTSVPVFEQD